MSTGEVVMEVIDERLSQDEKWGEQNHPDGTGTASKKRLAKRARDECEKNFKAGTGTWSDILTEEFCEALAESDVRKLRAELIQVAAVAVSWVEAIDRREAT